MARTCPQWGMARDSRSVARGGAVGIPVLGGRHRAEPLKGRTEIVVIPKAHLLRDIGDGHIGIGEQPAGVGQPDIGQVLLEGLVGGLFEQLA